MKIFKKKNSGFSLVELMIVVAIIGVLSALAVPRFQAFQAKAKATEGKTSLAHIFTLQQAYHGDNDGYGTLANIGFSLNGVTTTVDILTAVPASKVRFTYDHTAAPTATAFTARASAGTAVLGGCQTSAYTGTVNQNNTVAGFASVIPGC